MKVSENLLNVGGTFMMSKGAEARTTVRTETRLEQDVCYDRVDDNFKTGGGLPTNLL